MLPVWCSGTEPAHPRDPKSDSLLAGAGKNNMPVAAALRGGRSPWLASLVARGCFLTRVRYSNFRTYHSAIGREVGFCFPRWSLFNYDSYCSNEKYVQDPNIFFRDNAMIALIASHITENR